MAEPPKVYIPVMDHGGDALELAVLVRKGSGIVGRPYTTVPRMLEVYYEGNLYGSSNIVTFADRVYHAADRMRTAYPTTARGVYPAGALEHVGFLDDDRVSLIPDGGALTRLARWIGAGELDGDDFTPDTSRLDSELRRTQCRR